MQEKADVVIIGSGIIGCSIAYFLSEKNYGNISVLEKEPILGARSTFQGLDVIKQQFSSEVNIEMAKESVRFFEKFEDEMENSIGFKQTGSLSLLSNEEIVTKFREYMKIQKSLRIDIDEIDIEEIKNKVPQLNTQDIISGIYCSEDGYADGEEILHGFMNKAKENGVQFFTNTEAKDVIIENEEVAGVQTDEGIIDTKVVVNAAGAYADLIGDLAGVEMYTKPLRYHRVESGKFSELEEGIPYLSDVKEQVVFIPNEKTLIAEGIDKKEIYSYTAVTNARIVSNIWEKTVHRFPDLRNNQAQNSWSGLYCITPDNHAIVGQTRVKGFIAAVGFNNYGIMMSPAVGRIVSDLVKKGKTDLDISRLNINRFEEEKLLVEKNAF